MKGKWYTSILLLNFKKQGLESKKLEEIYLAETMLQSVEIIRKEEDEERKEGNEILKTLEKTKTSLLDNCFSKPPNNWLF